VTGQNRWAAVRHASDMVVIEATTEPNTEEVWAHLQWSGDRGELVPGHLNRRRISRANSVVLRPAVSLGDRSQSVEIWVLWATIEIISRGAMPPHAASFDDTLGQESQELGPVTYQSITGTMYPGDRYVLNMGARGKIVAVATLTPANVHTVIATGWTFRRERMTRQWASGQVGNQTAESWTNDTSDSAFLRLRPDDGDMIYDTDGPNIRWGSHSYEIYHNFRQWVEWHSQRCSEYGSWYFRACWRADPDQGRQIVLNEVGTGERPLPQNPSQR
jgi:hypothetical protein